MQFQDFVRKPFTVDAVEVTKDNIEQLAEELKIGVIKNKEDGTPFIQVDKRMVPNVYRVFPGYWVTKMGDNVRCYSKKVFHEQFIENTPDIQKWIDWMNGKDVTFVPEVSD